MDDEPCGTALARRIGNPAAAGEPGGGVCRKRPAQLPARNLAPYSQQVLPLLWNVPGRMVGDPPLQHGKLKGVTIDHDTMRRELLEYVGWHPQTTVPSEESLRKLGMEFLLEDVAAFQVPPA